MYTIDRVIGEGSFGKVFLTTQGTAIKSFRRLQSNMSKISCIREYDTFIKLIGCENIVTLKNIVLSNPFKDYVLGHDVEDIFFIMERCWKTGDEYIKHNLTFKERVKYVLDIALGLEFMHSRGIQHNDLKPDNILVFKVPNGDYPVAKLTDFGFSKMYAIQDYCNPSVYVKSLRAPEIREERNYRFSHDVWAYSLMMLNLFSGRNISTSDIYKMAADQKIDLLRSLDSRVRVVIELGLSSHKISRDNISELINCELFDDFLQDISKSRARAGINRAGKWITKPLSIYKAANHHDRLKFFAYTTELSNKSTYDVVMLHTQHNVDRYLTQTQIKKHSPEDIFVTWNAIYFLCFKYYAFFLDEHKLLPIELDVKLDTELLDRIQVKEKELLHDCFRGHVICSSFPEEVNGTYPLSEHEISWILWFIKNMSPGEVQSIFEIVKLMRCL